ncbi:MAG TPA: hypothetical protein VIH57_19145 [Bacteroidales bacterium]
MENVLDTSVQTNPDFQLDNTGIESLNETRKWTMFISILGFIVMGLMIIGLFVAILVAGSMGGMQATGYSSLALIPMLILAAIYFFPLYFLLMFSKNIANGLRTRDSAALNNGFRYLKLHYRFMGILVIVIISIYILVIIIAVATGGFLGSLMR